jgi:hypothetical protein
MSGFALTMWVIWGVLVATLVAVKIYIGRLSQDEDDQIFLDDAFDRMRSEQEAIAARVNRVQPLRIASTWMVVAASVFVAGYYVMDFMTQFK